MTDASRFGKSALLALGTLFVATGATALVAEQAFEKLLGTLLGTSTHAAAAVLAIYFGGLTLGGFAYRIWRRAGVAPISVYAVLELGVGAWALLLFLLFERLITVFVPVLALGIGRPWLMQVMRLLVAGCWILPPTILMGSSFPAIVDALSSQASSRRLVTAFYALNVLGAVVGAAAAPYVLFPRFGIDGGLLATAAVDIAVAATAFFVVRPRLAPAPVDPGAPARTGAGGTAAASLLILASGVSGVLFFALEVLWTHLIAVVLGNSVYAFATMLLMVLAGLFLGSLAASALFPERPVGVLAPVACLALSTLLLVAQHLAWPHVPHRFTVWGAGIHTFARAELLRAGIASLLLVPPSIPLGMVFPLLFRLREFPVQGGGVVAGRMVAANAFGSILGALGCAFVAVPAIGSEATLLGIVLTYSVIAVAVAFLARARGRALVTAIGAAGVLLAGLLPPWNRLALTSGEHVYFRPLFVGPASQLLFFHEDTASGITTVVRDPRGGPRVLLTNGKFQGNDGDERAAQVGIALAPILHVPRLERALVIGLGTGQSAHVVDAVGFGTIDVAEIAPGIVEAAEREFRAFNGGVMERGSVRLHVEDGRNLLLLHPARYDLVTMEISSLWFAGATNLYSREFYELAASRLAPGGVFQQWVQLHHIGAPEILGAIASVRAVFPHVSFWFIGGQGIVVATKEPQVIRAVAVSVARRLLASDAWLARHGVTVESVLGSRILAPQDVDRLLAATRPRVNTDRNRMLEYASPRYNLVTEDLASSNLALFARFASRGPHLIEPQAEALLAH